MIHPSDSVDAAILGGSGYVAGELLRLLVQHPVLRVHTIVSSSRAGSPVVKSFGHMQGTEIEELTFDSLDALLERLPNDRPLAVFTATPHGSTAPIVDALLGAAEARDAHVHMVDLSADFRFRDPSDYQALYGKPHASPERLPLFTCAVPEQLRKRPAAHAVQPGCFTTAVTLAAHPFVSLGLVEGTVFASAITGSSGSGQTPGAGTHHPSRRSNLVAYAPLAHRREAEMRALLTVDDRVPNVAFVPHSGPFVRGIHATLHLRLRQPLALNTLIEQARDVYRGCPFVRVGARMPRLADVVGTNLCLLGVAVRGRNLVVTSVIDNLVKGAAGGAVQWMNRLLDLPEDTGLRLPGLGWF